MITVSERADARLTSVHFMGRIPACFLEPTDRAVVELRKFTFVNRYRCATGEGGCAASVVLDGEIQLQIGRDGSWVAPALSDYINDPRWPHTCQACGLPMPLGHEWEVLAYRLYQVVKVEPGCCLEVGAETTLPGAPKGAVVTRNGKIERVL